MDILHLFQTIIIFSISFIALFINNRSYLNNASSEILFFSVCVFVRFGSVSCSKIKEEICSIYPCAFVMLAVVCSVFFSSSFISVCVCVPGLALATMKCACLARIKCWTNQNEKFINIQMCVFLLLSFFPPSALLAHSFIRSADHFHFFVVVQMTDCEWMLRVGYDLMAVCWSFLLLFNVSFIVCAATVLVWESVSQRCAHFSNM